MNTCPRCGEPYAESARFCSQCGAALPGGGTPVAEVRKTVTVMFCDVVGSTSLGERTDPELLRRVLTRYFDEIRTVVERHGGMVEKYIGDAVMAVFGVPTVHEDDALRALRAALEMRSRLGRLDRRLESERGISVSWRTGINTGEVVAGDAGAGQRFVTGDAVNVAARLERAAQPGEILVGEETIRLTRRAVHALRLDPLEAKGKAAPLVVHRLLELAPEAPSREQRLAAPMIGRQRPSRLLADAYEQSVAERVCHLVTVLGAAGVGKSRLITEFLEAMGEIPLVLRGRCLSYGDGITYWPIAELVRQAANLSEADDEEGTRAKLGGLVDDGPEQAQVVQRLGELIGRFEGSCTREESFWAIRMLVESLARRQPLILVLDDLHWAEPTLLDLVEHLADWIRETPVLLACLARGELLETRSGWGGGKLHATTLTLEPLSADESRQLVGELLGRSSLGGPLEQRIAAAAEGNPLFVEEMLGMLIDNGQLVHGESGWRAASDLAGLAVPPTIQALLAARLDGLPAAERAVLERAAIEGKVFHRRAVIELAPEGLRPDVARHLQALARKDLLRSERSEFAGDEAFRFRHLLVRDAAYAAMPKETRAELHAQFAAWLERTAAEWLSEHEEILGYHYEQAFRLRSELGPLDAETRRVGQVGAAHLGVSGERALDRGDVTAAQKLLSSAAELVPPDDQLRTRLQAELGLSMAISGELRSADDLLSRTIEHAEAAGDDRGRAYAQLIRLETEASLSATTVHEIIDRASGLLAVLEKFDDRRGRDRATFELARHQFFAGNAKLAEEILLGGIARYGATRSPPLFLRWLPSCLLWGPTPVAEATRRVSEIVAAPVNRDSEAVALQSLGLLRAMVGDFDEGRTLIRRGVAVREELGHQVMALVSLGNFLGSLEVLAGDYEAAESVLKLAYESLSQVGERGFSATIAGLLGSAYIAQGRIDEAQRYADLACELAPADDMDAQPRGYRARARVLAARGQPAEAEAEARKAVAMVEQSDYLPLRGETYADLAEVLLADGRVAEAADALRQAGRNFEAKGATVEVARVERRLAEVTAATV